MANKPLTLNNLVTIRDSHPGLYDDLVRLVNHVNTTTNALGGTSAPIAAGGIVVTGTNGVIDVQITDNNPQMGEEYFLEYDSVTAFTNAHVIGPLAGRNYRTSTLAGQTTYWRWYKSTKLGGNSNKVTFGNPPTAVTPGNLSTVSPGPAPSASRGSGLAQIPGYGWHPITKAQGNQG